MKFSHLILLPLFGIVFVSGCIGGSPEDLARLDPTVQGFLNQYPNAEVRVTYFSEAQAANIIETIREDCDNPQAEPKNFYRVTIEDAASGLSVTSWIDWDSRLVECAIKKGIAPTGTEFVCGNGICEAGEAEVCQEDCGEGGTGRTEKTLAVKDTYCDAGTTATVVLQNIGDTSLDINECNDIGSTETATCGSITITRSGGGNLDEAGFDKTGFISPEESTTFTDKGCLGLCEYRFVDGGLYAQTVQIDCRGTE